MSDRERWIVYPLLFLALSLALRDKLLDRIDVKVMRAEIIDADLIQCQGIRAFGEDGKLVARFGPLIECRELRVNGSENPKRSGSIVVHGHDGRAVVAIGADETSARGVVSTLAAGRAQTGLTSNETGGLVRVFDQDNELALVLGHFDRGLGLLAGDSQGRLIPWLPSLVRKRNHAPGPGPGPPDPTDE